jgi:hypothetical protein
MSTMAGIGPSSSNFRDPEEPVYLLTQRRSSFPPPPTAASRLAVASESAEPQRDSLAEFVRRGEARLDDAWSEPSDDADDDVSDIRVVRRFTRRRLAIRLLGAFAIVGALAGGTYVLQQPQVRDEALSFVTMGHEGAAKRAGHRIAAFVEALRHR